MKAQPQGITLIEVLFATSILVTVILSSSSFINYVIQTEQQAYWQVIISEQLHGLSVLLQVFPRQRNPVMADWTDRTKSLLPNYFAWTLVSGANQSIQIRWKTPIESLWRCYEEPIPHQSCLGLWIP